MNKVVMICSVFKSPMKSDTYLYVKKGEKFSSLPEPLMRVFGEPIHVMDIPLPSRRQLARVSAADLMLALEEQGYFLQLPPPEGESLLGSLKSRGHCVE